MINAVIGPGIAVARPGHNPAALAAIEKNNPGLPFSFAFLGDSRNTPVFTAMAKKLTADKSLSFTIIGGDLVNAPRQAAFATFLRRIDTLGIPALVLPGNHDVDKNDESMYRRIFGPPYYAFTMAGTRFIILDDSNQTGIDARQWAWLEKQLRAPARHRLVFMHVPPWDPGADRGERGHCLKNADAAEALIGLLGKYRVDFVFASHIHAFYQSRRQGVKLIISGGAGARLDGPAPGHAFYHYLRITVAGSGIKTEVVNLRP